MNITGQTIRAILEKHDTDVQWCGEYGEPGYDTPENGILFANWNKVPRTVSDWLEHHGYACEWSDEWIISYETNKAYRSSPDSYGWLPSYFITESGDVIGRDEIESGNEVDAYIEHLLNNPRRADTFNVDWSEHGFSKLNEDSYESGYHPGQTDNPVEILKAAQRSHPDSDFLFSIDGAGQFDQYFSLWMREQDQEDSDHASE